MKIQSIVLAGALAAITSIGAVSGVQAQDYRYKDYTHYHFYMGNDKTQMGRRTILRDRLFRLSQRLDREVRNGTISRHAARKESERLDRVSDFLMNDKHIKSSEFDDRTRDLDRVENDLRDHHFHD